MDNADRTQPALRPVELARTEDRAARAAKTKVHGIIPYGFFSLASSECRELYLDGHFYGCVSLAQAVAEGLAKFIGKVHPVGATKDPAKRVQRLLKKGVISDEVHDAFLRVWGNDRNTFHHLNEDIPVDVVVLEKRAKECVDALHTIESAVFAFGLSTGAIVPKNPEYWPKTGADRVAAYLRLT